MIDRSTFEELVRRHHAAVYRAARRVVRSDADAEDVTQQVFLKLLQGRARLGDDAGASLGWLASRLALNLLRDGRMRRRHEQENAMTAAGSDRTVERLDDQRAVREHVAGLPDDLRVPLVLRFQQGLTFAGVANVLQCSESSAHERVRRALESLRQRLSKAGFAALAIRVDDVLPRAEPVTEVPAGLEQSLLALTAATPVSLGITKLAALALVVVGGALTWRVAAGGGGDAAPIEPVTPVVHSSAAPASAEAASSAAGTAPATRRRVVEVPAGRIEAAHLVGVVSNSETGRPVAGAIVTARSVESLGKRSRFAATDRSDDAGRFELEVPIAHGRGQSYRLFAVLEGYRGFASGDMLIAAGERRAGIVAGLTPFRGATRGDWELVVTVADPAGNARAGARVSVERLDGPAAREEQRAVTDADGQAVLRGEYLGAKRLHVSLADSELAWHEEGLVVDGFGPHARIVMLRSGATIRGTVRALDGTPVANCRLHARAGDGRRRFHWSRTDARGAFELRGLDRRAYPIRGDVAGFSPFGMTVEAGTDGVEVTLKRADDPRPLGDFLGEIHGRVVDGVSGRPIEVGPWAVRTWFVRDEIGDWRREILPELLSARPVQIAAVLSSGGDPPKPSAAFHETGLARGRYLVFARVRGYALAVTGPFAVGPGRLESDVRLELFRGGTIAGRVVDSAGDPVANAVVYTGATDRGFETAIDDTLRSLVETSGRTSLHLTGEVRTDAEGEFVIEAVPPGVALRLWAAHHEAGAGSSGVTEIGDRQRARVTIRLDG